MWNSTMTAKDHHVYHGKWFCKSEHLATQHDFSWSHQSSHNLPLYSTFYWTATVTNLARRGERTTINKRQHQGLTSTNIAVVSQMSNMAKGIQISRVMSSNPTHLTKILAVNHKQLSSDTIEPPIFMVPMGWQCQGRATVGKVSKFE